MKLKKVCLTVVIFLGLAGSQLVYLPSVNAGLFDEAKKEACGGAQLSGASADCSNANTSNLDNTIQTIVNILTVIIGIVAVIMIVINGFKFITSGGDTNKVSSAKNGILYAIIGLIIVALAQFIVQFAINASKPPVTPPPTPPAAQTSPPAPAGQGAPAPRPPGGASGGTRNVAP